MLPLHLKALLSRSIAPPAAVVPVRDRAPVFQPSQSGTAKGSRVASIIEESDFDTHELDAVDNTDNLVYTIEQ